MNNPIYIIKPGHYCSNDTLNSEVKHIIRIMCADTDNEGYWITSDGSKLHESRIQHEYTALDTHVHDGSKAAVKRNIMAGFQPIHIDIENEQSTELYQPVVNQTVFVSNEIKHQPVANQTAPEDELISLISRAHIDKLNDSSQKKYGIKPYSSSTINISIPIVFEYDFVKLQQICELFDIDMVRVAEILTKNVKLPTHQITQSVLQLLQSDNIKQNDKPIVNQQENIQNDIEYKRKPLTVNDIQSAINKIDNLLSDNPLY